MDVNSSAGASAGAGAGLEDDGPGFGGIGLSDLAYADAGDSDEPDEDYGVLEPEDCTDEELGIGQPLAPGLVEAELLRRRQRREAWRYLPDDPLPESPPVAPATVGSVVRALRWHARLSQRELAAAAGVPLSAVTRAEQAGGADLRLSTLERVLELCGLQLAVVDDEGTQLAVPFSQNQLRDRADRRLPAHRRHQVRRRRWAIGVRPGPVG